MCGNLTGDGKTGSKTSWQSRLSWSLLTRVELSRQNAEKSSQSIKSNRISCGLIVPVESIDFRAYLYAVGTEWHAAIAKSWCICMWCSCVRLVTIRSDWMCQCKLIILMQFSIDRIHWKCTCCWGQTTIWFQLTCYSCVSCGFFWFYVMESYGCLSSAAHISSTLLTKILDDVVIVIVCMYLIVNWWFVYRQLCCEAASWQPTVYKKWMRKSFWTFRVAVKWILCAC